MLAAPCVDTGVLGGCDALTTGTTTNGAATNNGLISSIASSAWDAVCNAFGEAAAAALKAFAQAFASFPSINPQDAGVRSVYAISLSIAGVIAALLLLLQIVRTVVTHDGTGLAQAVTGLGKSALAFLLTLTVSTAAISAANELTRFIIDRTFTNTAGLQTKLTALFVVSAANDLSATLILVLAVVAILLTLVLWFELLLANAAIAVLIGTSPIAAAGQTSALTAGWWPKLVSATVQLIILKPVIALVFAVGFSLVGNSTDLAGNMTGLLVLLLAVLAWPAIARFFTFASVAMGGGTGLAAVLGFAAVRVNGGVTGQTAPGSPDGATGDDFASTASQRSLATHAARGGAGAGVGAGGAAGAGAGAGAGGAAAGGAAAAGPAGLVAAAVLDAAQRGVNALTGRMEQTARHAGLDGANAHPYPAGYPRHAPVPMPRPSSGGGGGSSSGQSGGGSSGPDLTWPGQSSAPEMTAPADTSSAPGDPAPDIASTSGADPGATPPAAAPGGTGQEAAASASAQAPPVVESPSVSAAEAGSSSGSAPAKTGTAEVPDSPGTSPQAEGSPLAPDGDGPSAGERRSSPDGAPSRGQSRRQSDPASPAADGASGGEGPGGGPFSGSSDSSGSSDGSIG